MSYIKPLNASMGPKETLCNIKDESENADPEGYYTDVTTTQTPVRSFSRQFTALVILMMVIYWWDM